MPIYEYQAKTENTACQYCLGGFERLQKLADAALLACPECGNPVKRVISAPSVQRGQAHLLKPKHVEQQGFTQYRKVGKGKYEKTAGQGPSKLSA